MTANMLGKTCAWLQEEAKDAKAELSRLQQSQTEAAQAAEARSTELEAALAAAQSNGEHCTCQPLATCTSWLLQAVPLTDSHPVTDLDRNDCWHQFCGMYRPAGSHGLSLCLSFQGHYHVSWQADVCKCLQRASTLRLLLPKETIKNSYRKPWQLPNMKPLPCRCNPDP